MSARSTPPSATPRAVVFDMDGLLVNTESLRIRAVEDCARDLGCAVRLDLFVAFVGGASGEARAALEAHVRDDLPPGFWRAYRGFMDRRMEELRPMPGALELLAFLESRGIPCAIATSAARASVEKYCAPLRLLPRFQTVVAREDYARKKPAPDAYLEAAARLRLPPGDCLALEDSYNGVRAAVAAGMATFMAPDVLPATDEMRALCLDVVSDLHDVLARLRAEG